MIVFNSAVRAAIRRRAQREEMQLHIASYGGSGTSFVTVYVHRQQRCETCIWHELLNHYAEPINLGLPRLVLMADPPIAYASCVRRDNWRGVCRNLHGGQYGHDHVAGMVEFFDRWTALFDQISTEQRLVFCKYESLYEHLPRIADALGIDFSSFPEKLARRSLLTSVIDPRLLALRERFQALPAFLVRG